MFFITHTETGNSNTAVIDIDGPLNSETSSDFEEYTSKLAGNGIINLLINSGKINFISSEGIGAVLFLHRKISSMNGVVVFFSLGREISILFHLLGFDRLINIVPDMESALEFAGDKSRGGAGAESPQPMVPGNNLRGSAEYRHPPSSRAADEPRGDDHAAIRPFVIECVKCSSPVRVSMKGEHYCPYCSAPFTVSGEGNAIFRINDIPPADR